MVLVGAVVVIVDADGRLLAFGGTALGCIAARSGTGPLGWLRGFLVAQVYTPYTWFLWPVLLRSAARQLGRHGDWAKTEREPLAAGSDAGGAPDPEQGQRLQGQPRPQGPARDPAQV